MYRAAVTINPKTFHSKQPDADTVQFLGNLFQKPHVSQGVLAISFLPNGFAVAATRYTGRTIPALDYCEFVPAAESQLRARLIEWVNQNNLRQYDCHILLTVDQYQSISLEAPNVEREELQQAARWKVAEFLDYPVDEADLDLYLRPTSNRPNTPQQMEVLVCHQSVTTNLVSHCQAAGLRIKVIDVNEAALRNLATLLPENDAGVAVLHLNRESGWLIMQKSGALYLSRKISQGYQQLTENTGYGNDSLGFSEYDNLALEIQRSLDYVENYFGIPAITSLATILTPTESQTIINGLTRNLGIAARIIDLSAIIDSAIPLDDGMQNLCAPVVGASLRRFEETGSL